MIKKSFFNYFVLAFASAVMFVLGCSTRTPSPRSENAELLIVQEYVSKYGTLSSRLIERYFDSLFTSLNASLLFNNKTPKVLLLNSEQPVAFCAGDQFILLSKKLVCSLKEEPELAFILAHEIGHQALSHRSLNSENNEYEADEFAINALLQSQFNAEQALEVFTRFPEVHIAQDNFKMPPAEQRRLRAQNYLKARPIFLGNQVNRAFYNLQQSLCH